MALKPTDLSDHPGKWSANDPWIEVEHTPGAFPSSPQPQYDMELTAQRSLAAMVKERRQEYIRKKHIKVKVGTWNVASIGSTRKDLASWFLKGLGVKGLHQDLSGLNDSEGSSSDENIESVAEQESRYSKKQSTVPIGEIAAVSSDDDVGLYVLGLQEVIDISSFTEAMRPYYDPNPAKKWKHAMKKGLPRGYVKIAEQQLLGLLILIYAAPQVAPEITSVDCTSVGTGALGYVGNKGAVSVRLVLGGTTRMLFVNCHLAAGADQAALNRRIWDTSQVVSRTKFQPAILDGDVNPVSHESIGDEDFAFWFGDLNYRLDDIPGEDVRRLLLLHTRNEYDILNKSKMRIDSELGYIDAPQDELGSSPDTERSDGTGGVPAKESSAEPPLDPKDDPASLITTINSLLSHDQLRAQQRLRKAFYEGWREGEINFLPTYKYDIGSVGMFDSGEKKRSPSWCDRILYRTRRDMMEYEERAKQEEAARKRDAEMKAKGLDTESAEQEILFDYDPATDGTYDYDEDDDVDDNQDTQSVITQAGLEDTITLENYISHQRVLSSDHKPLSAVFNFMYDAVIPELRAQVQQEAARVLDKNENETRPSVTVVVDHPPESSAHADKSAGRSELNCVEFGEIRFDVPRTRTLTLANTGFLPATFAFIDRPVGNIQEKGPFPSWMDVQVHHESQLAPKDGDNLGTSTRFVLSPGEIATVEMTINIKEAKVVRDFNEGLVSIDDVLVLRILGGRDHFVSFRGTWCSSSFYRHLDELVRFPNGVRSRSTSKSTGAAESHRNSPEIYHSAPKELFELARAIVGLVRRATADWAMINQDVTPPWNIDPSWPFQGQAWKSNSHDRSTQLADIREALDTATPLTEHFDEQLPPLARVELLADTLILFLQSLQDGVIPASAWQIIEEKLALGEKSKIASDPNTVQEIVMDALSSMPVHSVSLTFVTYMLTRVATELDTNAAEVEQSPISPTRRTRSSTETSETASEVSLGSLDSKSTISSFLPSLTKRVTGKTSTVVSPTTSSRPIDRKVRHVDAFSDFWANIIIRSEHDALGKGKEKKALDMRKKKVILALLTLEGSQM